MRNNCLNFIVIILLLSLYGCGVNKVRVADIADGPKDLFVSLTHDPLLISVELKAILESKGYRVALSTEEPAMAQTVINKNIATTYKSVSESVFRYELQIGYSTWYGVNSDRIAMISASLRDREKNKILGTWRWKWDQLLSPPTPEEAVEMIENNLLNPIFEKGRKAATNNEG
jgi:hypothetical protein